ncbi:hypothetical protein DFH09DRAFT_1457438 [Mycena vulgaris]|nr:hypothetical protein DFH09DRAFT_1457438 [Mycena vulgaris]
MSSINLAVSSAVGGIWVIVRPAFPWRGQGVSRALAANRNPHFVRFLTPDILRRRRLATEAADTTPGACTCGKTNYTPLNPWTHHPNTPRDDAIAPHLPTFPRRLLPEWYSCNWIEWTDSHFLRIAEGWHDLSPARAIITHGFGITGTIRPLAFCEAQSLGAQINGIPGGCVHQQQRGSSKRTFNCGLAPNTYLAQCLNPRHASFHFRYGPEFSPPTPTPALPPPSQIAYIVHAKLWQPPRDPWRAPPLCRNHPRRWPMQKHPNRPGGLTANVPQAL